MMLDSYDLLQRSLREPPPCRECDGFGQIQRPPNLHPLNENDETVYEFSTCPVCEGTGNMPDDGRREPDERD